MPITGFDSLGERWEFANQPLGGLVLSFPTSSSAVAKTKVVDHVHERAAGREGIVVKAGEMSLELPDKA